MAQRLNESPVEASFTSQEQASTRSKAHHRKQLIPSLLLQLLAMVGIGLLLYPSASNWISELSYGEEIAGYVREVDGLGSEDRARLLAEAQSYNSQIPDGILQDPFSTSGDSERLTFREDYPAYLNMLKVQGTDSIGELSYPDVDIYLPIYHGTTDSIISKGVGHLFGSSLPVGGPSTHAVLTSHSGLVKSDLFTPLLDAEVGDSFRLSILGEDMTYQVRNVEMVLPHEAGSLKIRPGEDWITLLTCAPIGVNSHRFLVHAERVDSEISATDRILANDSKNSGFPWWLLIFFGVSLLSAYLIFTSPRLKSTKPSGPKHALKGERFLALTDLAKKKAEEQ